MKLLSLILILAYSFSSLADNSWETMKVAYDFHFKGEGGIEKLLSPEGEKRINQIHNYIFDSKNSDKINTPDGQKLLQNHQKYLNFLQAKKTLEACENDKNSKRKLEGAILTGILDTSPTYIPCKKEILQTYQAVFELNNNIDKISQEALKDSFIQGLNFQSTINTFDSYLKNKYRYDPDFLRDKNRFEYKEETVKKFCEGSKYCTPEQTSILEKRFDQIINKQYKNGKRVSYEEVAKSINDKINGLNEKLDSVEIKRDKGVLSDHINNGVHFVVPYMIDTADPDLEDKKTQSQFNSYLSEYINTTAEGDGILMHTKSIRDEMGNLRTIDDDENIDEDTHFADSSYTFEKHNNIDEYDVEDAVEDMFDGIDDQIKKLKRMNLGMKNLKKTYDNSKNSETRRAKNNRNRLKGIIKKQKEKNLNFLVKTNPKAVSQMLATSPEYAGLVCSSLLAIDEEDKNSTGNGDLFIWGGVALGALGFITGGATWLLGGALAAGTTATLGTVTTGVIIASTATTAVGSAISFNESRVLNSEAKSIENGILSGSSYTTSSEQMRDSYLSYKDALFDATTNATLSLTGMGALGSLNKLGKTGAKIVTDTKGGQQVLKITDKVVDNLTDFYNAIRKSKTASLLLNNTVKKLGPNGQAKLDEFLAQVAYLPEATRQKLLLGILTMAPTSTKLASLIKKAQCKK